MNMKQQVPMLQRKLNALTDERDIQVMQSRIDRIKAMSRMPMKARYSISDNYKKTKRPNNIFAIGFDIDRLMQKSIILMISRVPELIKTREQEIEERLKFARITYKGEEGYITMVDNKTMIAYKMSGANEHYYNGIKKPLEAITEPYTFERWCRGMDL